MTIAAEYRDQIEGQPIGAVTRSTVAAHFAEQRGFRGPVGLGIYAEWDRAEFGLPESPHLYRTAWDVDGAAWRVLIVG